MSTYQTHKELYLKFKDDALREDLYPGTRVEAYFLSAFHLIEACVAKGKIYLSRKSGLVAKLGGMRAGKSSVLLPEKESWVLERKLSGLGIKIKKICAWLQKI